MLCGNSGPEAEGSFFTAVAVKPSLGTGIATTADSSEKAVFYFALRSSGLEHKLSYNQENT
jgi:hypothetical protein